MSKEIKIVEVKEVTMSNGQSFTAYKALAKDGKKMDAKFRKTVKNTPTEPCVIVVAEDKCNVDTSKQYPVLWVQDIEEVKPYTRENNVGKYF